MSEHAAKGMDGNPGRSFVAGRLVADGQPDWHLYYAATTAQRDGDVDRALSHRGAGGVADPCGDGTDVALRWWRGNAYRIIAFIGSGAGFGVALPIVIRTMTG